MAKGRKTGGRPPGAKNRTTIQRDLMAKDGLREAFENGILPLTVILTVMRGGPDADAITPRQYEAAVAAAPYVHPKLSAATVSATVRQSVEDFSDDELSIIARIGGAGGGDGTGEADGSTH